MTEEKATLPEAQEWAWLVETDKGIFYFNVVGPWDQKEAKLKLWAALEKVGVTIKNATERKRWVGSQDYYNSIIEYPEAKSGLGYDLYAGKAFWYACGRGADFEDQMKSGRRKH